MVPILRAGLVLLETAATVLPSCETYHVAQVRDEITMQVLLLQSFEPSGIVHLQSVFLLHSSVSIRAAAKSPNTTCFLDL